MGDNLKTSGVLYGQSGKYHLSPKRFLANIFSRNKMRSMHNLGVKRMPLPQHADKVFRNPALEILDAYYESRQYDHLYPWDSAEDVAGDKVHLRDKRPRIQYAFAKMMCQRLSSKLIGSSVFPTLKIEEDPDTTEYLRFIVNASKIKSRLLDPTRRILNSGSGLLRYFFVDGKIQIEFYLSKYCYPKFTSAGDLESIRVQYVFPDPKERDQDGNPVLKWYRLDLGQLRDILYDNPKFDPDAEDEPVFLPVDIVDHNMGFVQGEWFRTAEIRDTADGYPVTADILDFIDELNYSLSQSSQASSYNQDPQLVFKGMDSEEIGNLVRSSMKGWTLGRKDSDAKFLESEMSGVTVAIELRDKMRVNLQDIARITLHDPEKMVGHAQSAKAMEVLNAPMVELIDELRPMWESSIKSLVVKMAVTNLILADRGEPVAVTLPPGYRPASLDLTASWPPVFPMTISDLTQKVGAVAAATGASIISRETGTAYVAKDFGVENVEEEVAKIDAQPVINPFGMF